MPTPKQICLEDVRTSTPDARYLRCVALEGRAPGLRVDARGEVLWKSDDAIACELWVSLDDRLVLYRPDGAAPVRVERAGRAIDAPAEKPVILVDQDLVTVGGRQLRVHVHGDAPEVHAPAFVTEAMLRAARAVSAAALLGAAAAGCATDRGGAPAAPPIEVRESPPTAAPPFEPTSAPSTTNAPAPASASPSASASAAPRPKAPPR
jgi:hypothetical protein